MELEKIYTQEDMDNITSKVKESTIAKYEKTHISVDAYKELESKYNDLLMKDKANEIKQVFIANNGNEKAFNDFLNSHKELLNVDAKQLSNSISEISKEKQWYFNNVPQIKNEFEITKSMLKTNNDDIIDGTLTSREWIKR